MELEVRDDDVIADVVVLVRTASMGELSDALVIGTSDGCGGIVQYGIVCSAKLQLEKWMTDGET